MKSEILTPEVLEERRKKLLTAVRQHPEDRQTRKAYADFIKKYIVPEVKKEAQPYSFQEMFALMLEGAATALFKGDYAIAAAEVIHTGGKKPKQIVIIESNRSMSLQNTHNHAEEGTIDLAETLSRRNTIQRGKVVSIRPAPHDKVSIDLYTTLEPCIGCLRRLTTHKPNRVLIATPDVTAGAMLDGREHTLPPFWQDRPQRRGIEVIAASDDKSSPYYINPKYREIALEMFESTREYIDKNIKGINSSPETLLKYARRSRRRIFRKVF